MCCLLFKFCVKSRNYCIFLEKFYFILFLNRSLFFFVNQAINVVKSKEKSVILHKKYFQRNLRTLHHSIETHEGILSRRFSSEVLKFVLFNGGV